MPPLERTDLLHHAVVWPLIVRGGYDHIPPGLPYDAYGEPIVGPPFQIDVRWVARQTVTTDRQGNTIMLDATMILDEEVEDIPVGSIVCQASLWEVTGTGSFTSPNNELYQIKFFSQTPDIKARNTRRKAMLMRFRDQLPQVVAGQNPKPIH
jgi:hypothetical protein